MSSPFSKLGFRFHPHLHFNPRYFCNSANGKPIFIHDPCKFMNYVKKSCRLGFDDLQFPINLFHKMMSLVPKPSIVDFSRLFTAMLKHKRLHSHYTVISLFSHLDLSGIRPDLQSMSILANCYCHLRRVDFGYSLLAKSLKLGYPFDSDLILFNTLINGHVYNNQLREAIKLLDVAVVKLGIQPDIVTYGTMVKGLCGIGDNAGALHLLRRMNSHPNGCKPSIVIYNTLIDGLLKDKLVTEALNLFSVMKTEGIKPDVFTYNSMIRGMFNLGCKGEAKEMLVEMMESNIELNVATYNMLVDVYCKDKMTDDAEAILPIMIKRGLTPDVVAYSALMNGYCLCGQMDKARDLLDLMVKSNCQPDVVTFSTLINGFVKHHRIDKALDILHEMCEHGIAPNIVLYNILIDGLCEAGHVQDAENLVSDLLSRGLVPSRRTFYAHRRPVKCSSETC
ncbi:uncharacterized protein LOC141605004 [Silene latifolia]|uniref:uncharacterized protein LOC141605004 n=1 Tax=Silene latifolia TaxID=37657 RepID=UPI003D776698